MKWSDQFAFRRISVPKNFVDVNWQSALSVFIKVCNARWRGSEQQRGEQWCRSNAIRIKCFFRPQICFVKTQTQNWQYDGYRRYLFFFNMGEKQLWQTTRIKNETSRYLRKKYYNLQLQNIKLYGKYMLKSGSTSEKIL